MAIRPALRGISLILLRVKHGAGLLRRTAVGTGFKPFPTKDCLPDRQVKTAAGALHPALFDQPGKYDFFNRLLIHFRVAPHATTRFR
jgi:hypothetical protein